MRTTAPDRSLTDASAPHARLSRNHVETLRAAWLRGEALLPKAAAPRQMPAWNLDVTATIPEEQRAIIQKAVFYGGKARQRAADGDGNAAIQLFAMAGRHGRDPALDEQSRLCCASELEAAEAYFDYVCGDMESARQRLLASMTADEALEERFGHSVLHLHRIHLANNVVKVEARAKDLRRSLSLAANILEYVTGTTTAIDLPTRWGPEWTAALGDEARSFLIKQTTCEIACALVGRADRHTISLWRSSFPPGLRTRLTAEAPEVAHWYRAKDAFFDCLDDDGAEIDVYCDMAADYLSHGPRHSLLLWSLAGLDVALLCAGPAPDNALDALDLGMEIAAHLKQTASLPRHVRQVAERLASTPGPQQAPVPTLQTCGAQG